MSEIEKINSWDWPDSEMIPDEGYTMRDAPRLSRENLEFLAEKINEIIEHLSEHTKEDEHE